MPIFISYSHEDGEFVDRLATQVVRNNVSVWLDRWELAVGDSLIDKVQNAIAGASALLVILSQASTKSEWCKKELTAGLIRELDEKQVVVLPVIVDDCPIPLFLRDKVYADFRKNFDDGLKAVLIAVAKITTEYQARVDTPEWHTDWSIDWGDTNGLFRVVLTVIEAGEERPYSVLSTIDIFCDRRLTKNYEKARARGQDPAFRRDLVGFVTQQFEGRTDLRFFLEDQFAQRRQFVLEMPNGQGAVDVEVTCRWLGQDTGRAVLFNLGQQAKQIHNHMLRVAAHPKK